MKTSAAITLVIGVTAALLSNAGDPPKPSLDRAARQAIISAANKAVHKHMTRDQRVPKGPEISKKLWGDAIARLKPLRVLNDRVNVFIVLEEDEEGQEGLYVSTPISSYAPGADERFLRFEKLSEAGDKAFGQLYRCKLRKSQPATPPNAASSPR
jgi:hypothetical protein